MAATASFATGANARVAEPNAPSIQSSELEVKRGADTAQRMLADSYVSTSRSAEQTTATDGGVAQPKSKIKKSTLWLMVGLLAAIAVSSLVSAKRRAKQILES